MGLRIMQSRAGMMGGTLAIERNPGGGVSVICSVPVEVPRPENKYHHGPKHPANNCSSWTITR